jgi:hypothetical protein
MRIAIDMNDVAKCVWRYADADLSVPAEVEYTVVLTGASGSSLYEAWQQKQRDLGDQPQFKL